MPGRFDATYFERLFEGAGLAILASDLSGRITARNHLAERICVNPARIQVENVNELFTPEDAKSFEQALAELSVRASHSNSGPPSTTPKAAVANTRSG